MINSKNCYYNDWLYTLKCKKRGKRLLYVNDEYSRIYTRFIDLLLFCEKHIDFFHRYRNITIILYYINNIIVEQYYKIIHFYLLLYKIYDKTYRWCYILFMDIKHC